jgi:hypothetical protein
MDEARFPSTSSGQAMREYAYSGHSTRNQVFGRMLEIFRETDGGLNA